MKQALHSLPRLSNVDADVTDTAVLLRGSVSTQQDREIARDIAFANVNGRNLIDDLTISAGARPLNR